MGASPAVSRLGSGSTQAGGEEVRSRLLPREDRRAIRSWWSTNPIMPPKPGPPMAPHIAPTAKAPDTLPPASTIAATQKPPTTMKPMAVPTRKLRTAAGSTEGEPEEDAEDAGVMPGHCNHYL